MSLAFHQHGKSCLLFMRPQALSSRLNAVVIDESCAG